MDELRDYHLRRARTERELAERSRHERAAEAHLGLCDLHLEHLAVLDRKVAARAPGWSSCLGNADQV